MGVFQILWVYYGLLIASRPVVVWNLVAVLINFLTVGAYRYFVRREKPSKTVSAHLPNYGSGARALSDRNVK